MGFLNPLLLYGLPLAAVPVVIHLLNRRRFQRRPWAAMEFLRRALQKNRKRIRVEQLLLLLLRTLLVVLLILAVSRPQLGGGGLVGVRTHHVLVLDDSASMQQRAGVKTVQTLAADRIEALAKTLAEAREGDLVTLLRSGRPGRPELAAVRAGPGLEERLRQALQRVDPGDSRSEWAAVFRELAQRIAATPEAGRTEIVVLTDLRRVDWLGDDGRARPELEAAVRALDPKSVQVRIEPLAPDEHENLAITALRMDERVAVVGVPLTFVAEVTNLGSGQSSAGEVVLEIDGKTRVARPLAALPAGGRAALSFTPTFASQGPHGLLASLAPDRYAPDDRRALALDVRERTRSLLVDGDPRDGAEQSETYFLAAALESGGGSGPGVAVKVIAEHQLAAEDLAGFDTVCLCNVPAPARAVVEKLEAFVARGGGLLVFLGNQVEPARYAEALWREGKGLLPARPIAVAGDLDRPERVFLAAREHPVLAAAAGVLETLFARAVAVGRHLTLELDRAAPPQVLLRLGGPEGAPLLVARSREDAGTVLLCASTADAAWTNWPATPAYLVTWTEAQRFAAPRQDLGADNLLPSSTWRLALDPARHRLDVLVRALREDAAERTLTAGPDGALAVPMGEVRGYGLFEAVVTPHAGEPERRVFSRNAHLGESDLRPLRGDGLLSAYGAEFQQRVTVAGRGSPALQAGQSELWRLLVAGILIGLLLETFLAWRFGRRHG